MIRHHRTAPGKDARQTGHCGFARERIGDRGRGEKTRHAMPPALGSKRLRVGSGGALERAIGQNRGAAIGEAGENENRKPDEIDFRAFGRQQARDRTRLGQHERVTARDAFGRAGRAAGEGIERHLGGRGDIHDAPRPFAYRMARERAHPAARQKRKRPSERAPAHRR